MSQESKGVIGPALPAHLMLQIDSEAGSALPSRRVVGPTMPPSVNEEEHRLSSAAQAFLDREKRMKEAADRQAAGLPPLSEERSSRPEWMLAPPTAQSFSESLIKDQSAALKNRGFSQAQNARVQRGKGGAGLGGIGEEDTSLWTETPQEREKRLMEEEMGIRPKANAVGYVEADEDREKRKADQEREEQLQRAIREHNDKRGPSLLEQHQEKRRSEIRAKDKKRDKKERGSERRRRDESEGESSSEGHSRKHRRSEDGSSRHKHRRSERHNSASESESLFEAERRRERKHKSRHSRHDDRERSDRDRSRDREREDKHHRSHHSDSKDRDRDVRRKEKEREKEKRQKRKDRDREEKEEKKGAPMMVWDREAAMSVAGKLMDTQKRMDTIRSASGLGSRFGSGSARYL